MGINMVGFQFPEELLVQFEPDFCALSENEGLSFPNKIYISVGKVYFLFAKSDFVGGTGTYFNLQSYCLVEIDPLDCG